MASMMSTDLTPNLWRQHMMLNPGQTSQHQGTLGSFGNWGNWGQPVGIGHGPVMAAHANAAHGFGQPYGLQTYGVQPHVGFNALSASAVDDIADDIAERIASEITDQAASGAAALFQQQNPQIAGQPLSGLNIKRWPNAARGPDATHETSK